MSSAIISSTALPAIWNAGKVMPRYRKIHCPTNAKRMSTAAATAHAMPAVRIRSAGVSRGVIARNSGTRAIGSVITNREPSERTTNSVKLIDAHAVAG